MDTHLGQGRAMKAFSSFGCYFDKTRE